ncbi:MAG TPA: LUD domain-containing protein [Acidothermaceae bacterium]|jgi:L-lactate dehydrogenase complex protein LldG
MTPRDEVLTRIRTALAGQSASDEIPRAYRLVSNRLPGTESVIALFVERLTDYKATVYRTDASTLVQTLTTVLASDASVVLPPGAPVQWRDAASDARIDGDPGPLSATELDGIAAVVTGCRVAIADTGTIVLDAGPDQGRRVLTLVPDHHVVVVHAEQIVMSVPESLSRLDPTRPLTFISGPSATSDIEFKRVEGVHGPRVLDVIVVFPGSWPAAEPSSLAAAETLPSLRSAVTSSALRSESPRT